MERNILILITTALMSLNVHAGTVTCSGKVTSLAYHADNKLMIQLSSMNTPVFFCSPDTDWVVSGTGHKTGPETCKTMYSSFLAAKMAEKSISSMYFDGASVPKTCNTWEKWRSANIRFYKLND